MDNVLNVSAFIVYSPAITVGNISYAQEAFCSLSQLSYQYHHKTKEIDGEKNNHNSLCL